VRKVPDKNLIYEVKLPNRPGERERIDGMSNLGFDD